MDNNEGKIAEFGVYISPSSIGIGFGHHYEDRRWQNEVKVYLRHGLFENRSFIKGLRDFLIPSGSSAWCRREIAHETTYGWGLLGIYIDVPSIKTKSSWLTQ